MRETAPKKKLLSALAATGIIYLLLLLYAYFPPVGLGVWGSVLFEALFPAVAFLFVRGQDRDYGGNFPFGKPTVHGTLGSIGLYAGVLLVTAGINLLTSRLIPDFNARGDAINQSVLALPLPLSLFAMALVPAVCEELFCRGFLLKSTEGLDVRIRVLLSGLIFGFLHRDLYAFLPTMLLGCLFAYITVKTGSLWLPMLLHFVNNALAVISAYTAGAEASAEAITEIPLADGFLAAVYAWVFGYFLLFFAGKLFRWERIGISGAVIRGVICYLILTGASVLFTVIGALQSFF